MASPRSDGVVCPFDGARSISRVGGSRRLSQALARRSRAIRRGVRDRLGLALDGWSDDESSVGRGKKPGPIPTSRGKGGVKRSMLTEGHGVPIGAVTLGANRHDMKLVRSTIESIIVERPKATQTHPQGMCLDKGYDYDEVYATLREFGFTAHVRPRREEAKAIKREAGGLRAPLGRGTSPFLAKSLSPSARSVGEKAAELPGVAPFRLRLDRFSRRRIIRIGF